MGSYLHHKSSHFHVAPWKYAKYKKKITSLKMFMLSCQKNNFVSDVHFKEHIATNLK